MTRHSHQANRFAPFTDPELVVLVSALADMPNDDETAVALKEELGRHLESATVDGVMGGTG